MKREAYVRAVSRIRWTDEQRSAIEALLRRPLSDAPVQSQAENGREDGFVEVFYKNMHETENSAMAKEERKHKRLGRIGWVIVAAAILAAGGAVGAGVAYAKKQKLNGGDAQGVFHLHLTDDEDCYGRHILQRAESGYYFYKTYFNYETLDDGSFSTLIKQNPEAGYILSINGEREMQQQTVQVGHEILSYSDAETGEYAPLCARPNCTHDGSLFCTATTAAYDIGRYSWNNGQTGVIYADGYLYALAEKVDDPQAYQDADWIDETLTRKNHQVLLRYEPDGTGIEEIHDFGVGKGCCRPVLHRGYLWFSVQLMTYGEEVESPITHRKADFTNGGYEIWGYELRTGDLVKVFSGMGDPSLNHVNERPTDMYGIGDDLYIIAGQGDWVSGGGTRRLNLLTGEMTAAADFSIFFGFSGKYGLNCVDLNRNKVAGLVDLESGEMKLLLRDDDKETDYLNLMISGDYIISTGANRMPEWRYDSTGNIPPVQPNRTEEPLISILDLDGNELCKVKLPEIPEYPENQGIVVSWNTECILDGQLYLSLSVIDENPYWQLAGRMYACPVDDLISGKCGWKVCYETIEEQQSDEMYQNAAERARIFAELQEKSEQN